MISPSASNILNGLRSADGTKRMKCSTGSLDALEAKEIYSASDDSKIGCKKNLHRVHSAELINTVKFSCVRPYEPSSSN